MKPEEAQLARLIRLVKADGVLDAQEIELLVEMAERKGFTKEDLTRLADSTPAVSPDPGPERVRFFYQAVALALTDGDVARDELNVLRTIGKQLDLDPVAVEKVLDHLQQDHDAGLSREQMEGLFEW